MTSHRRRPAVLLSAVALSVASLVTTASSPAAAGTVASVGSVASVASAGSVASVASAGSVASAVSTPVRRTAAAPRSAAVNVEVTFTARLNGERSARGIPTLATRPALVTVAREQARRMAARAKLYHNPQLTSDVANWSWVGENVGYGPDAGKVHVAFMNSPAHRDNILDTDYTEVGIGAVVVNGRVWVTEVFRRPARTGFKSSGRSS